MKKAALTLTVLLWVNSIFATIHYTQVGEQVYSSTPRYYDVDLDGNNDFYFTAVDLGGSTGSTKFLVNTVGSTSFYAAEGTSDTLPKAYSEGAALGTYHWQNTSGLLSSPTTGYFSNTSKYLVVKFSDGTNTYYGWFFITAGLGLSVNSYAFSDVPDEIIKAGENEPTSILQINQQSFDLKLTTNNISFNDCSNFDHVKIFSVDGKKITEINNPVSSQVYPLNHSTKTLIIIFKKNGVHVNSAKHFVREW